MKAMLLAAGILTATLGAAGAGEVVWENPGCTYPDLGWRKPVDLHESDWRVDRALVQVPADHYNCHFYTRLHLVQRNQPRQLLAWLKQPASDLLTPRCLYRAGLRKLGPLEMARPGDVVVASRLDVRGETTYHHSAVVRAVDADGTITSIRQKFDGRHPVVDVDVNEFRSLYAGCHPCRVEVWGWSLGPRGQVAHQ